MVFKTVTHYFLENIPLLKTPATLGKLIQIKKYKLIEYTYTYVCEYKPRYRFKHILNIIVKDLMSRL